MGPIFDAWMKPFKELGMKTITISDIGGGDNHAFTKQGATVEFNTYQGGHGWHGDIFGNVRKGVDWLQDHAAPKN